MRNSIRCIALMLMLCVIVSATSMVAAADDFVDGSLVIDYNFGSGDIATLQTLFCMDARGFLKALAFRSAWTQSLVIPRLLSSEDPQALSAVSHLIIQFNRKSHELALTESEKNLLAAISFQKELWYGFGDALFSNVDDLLQEARYPVSENEYSDQLGLFLRDDPYNFIVKLSALQAKDQQTILAQLAMLNGTARSIPVVDILKALLPQQTEPANGEGNTDSPGPLEPGWVFTAEQTELINTILVSLKDTPPVVEPQDPIPEEQTQWRSNKIVPRTDFYHILTEIADGSSNTAFIEPMFLETASFVQAFALLQTSTSQEKVINIITEQVMDAKQLRHLLFNIRSHLTYTPDPLQKNAVAQLQYALLRNSLHAWGKIPDFSQVFDLLLTPPGGQSWRASDMDIFHLGINACWYPKEFIAAYTSDHGYYQSLVDSAVKHEFSPVFRQALIDTLYDLQSDESLSDAEAEAIEAFLAYQANTPNPMYPYGVDPNAPPPTEPTDPTDPTDATDPTATEPPTTDASEDTDSATGNHSHLLRTVLLSIAAFAIGIPIGSYYVNRKGRTAKTEEAADPPDTDEEEFL